MVNITNNLMYQLDILNQQNTKVSYQMSTGDELQNGSDDSLLYGYILGIEDDLKTYEGISSQLDKTTVFNSTSDSTISELKTFMESVTSEILTALNGTVDDTTKLSMASNLENIKESIFNLVNEDSNDMYLFSGVDTTVEPFVMNSDGSVDYIGDNSLKTTIVDKGLYKQQGVNGFDIMFFSTDKAAPLETLEFTNDQRILDSDGDEWMFIDHTGDGNIDIDALYLNGDVSATSLSVTSTGTPPTYSVVNSEAVTLEAKSNYFDVLDEMISALNSEDTLGNSLDSDEAREVLSASLDSMESAYNSINKSHAILGGRNESFDNYSTSMSAKITNLQIFYEEFASADLTKAAVEAQSLEITYSALYSTISKLNSLSLVNFI